jgi:hypothetical protein
MPPKLTRFRAIGRINADFKAPAQNWSSATLFDNVNANCTSMLKCIPRRSRVSSIFFEGQFCKGCFEKFQGGSCDRTQAELQAKPTSAPLLDHHRAQNRGGPYRYYSRRSHPRLNLLCACSSLCILKRFPGRSRGRRILDRLSKVSQCLVGFTVGDKNPSNREMCARISIIR